MVAAAGQVAAARVQGVGPLAPAEVSYVSSGPRGGAGEAEAMHAYVRDVMTTDVVAVRAGTPYREMTAMFRQHRVSGFPVVDDDGKVTGVVSETDLLAVAAAEPDPGAQPAPRGWRPHRKVLTVGEATAGALITHPAVTVRPGRDGQERGPPDVLAQAAAAPGRRPRRPPGRHHQPVRRAERLPPDRRGDPPRGHPGRDRGRVLHRPSSVHGDRARRDRHAGRRPRQRRARRQHRRPGPAARGRGRRPRPLHLSGIRAVFVTAGRRMPQDLGPGISGRNAPCRLSRRSGPPRCLRAC